ncbi:hypothetical protein PMI15_04692 [Polaromonas sp. CF318]|uniref:hypothetical protein n=1 Tax=Polaromonas sp. CF318 TaxID=1144318 RepID=UPI0002714529|nr:hypothetical protein [Polaromonas sp. CF318]EJL77370.1 hypothetical protein PMI15_04692 [Polaromonas sp. CF318]
MITLNQYVGPHRNSPDWTPTREQNATKLLAACAALEVEMSDAGVAFPDNPATGSGVSGQTFGGFRPQDCPQGAANSSHKQGQAVDRYDPDGEIDAWLMANQDRLVFHGLYIEHPSATPRWSHWTTRAPGSGNRVFYP